MDNPKLSYRSFDSTEEWLEAFICDQGLEMRVGRLNAILNPKNFENQVGLSKISAPNTQTLYILEALNSRGTKKSTIEYGLDLILSKIIITREFDFPKGVKKTTFLKVLNFLRKVRRMPGESVRIDSDDLNTFLHRVIWKLESDKNSFKENLEIINTAEALNRLHFFVEHDSWRGNDILILKLEKILSKSHNYFTEQIRDALAIHLAARSLKSKKPPPE
ncbi:MAG TPA: hypothetical protein VHQ41_00795 [Patescibacteria group bacterium]|jgi:hypothetical protein|nr:hypothetical protein [Patescibacteria group bacterium]